MLRLLLPALVPSSRADEMTEGAPFVRVFHPADYGGASVNLHLATDRRGFVFLADSLHVFEYDGASWRQIPQPALTPSSALVLDESGRVWTSLNGALCQLAPDDAGTLRFSDQHSRLPAGETSFGQLLGGLVTGDGLYIFSAQRVFLLRHDGGTTVWHADTQFESLFVIDGVVHVTQVARGLARLGRDRVVPIETDRGPWPRIFAAHPAADGRGYILLTSDGPRRWTEAGSGLETFGTAWHAGTVLHAQFLADGRLAFGTAEQGLVICDREGRFQLQLAKRDGLPSERVNEIAEDAEGGLWLALQKGVARVQLDSPFRVHGGTREADDNVRDVIRHAGRLYTAHGEGVSVLDPATGEFRRLGGLPANTIGATTFLATGDRLFVNAAGVREITPQDTLILRAPQTLYALHVVGLSGAEFAGLERDANGRGLWMLTAEGAALRVLGKVAGLDDAERFGFAAPDGFFWGTDTQRRVWRADFRGGLRADAPVEFFALQPVSANEDTAFVAAAFPFDGGVDAVRDGKVFRFDPAMQRFAPETRIVGLPSDLGLNAPEPAPDGSVWLHSGKWGERARIFHVTSAGAGQWQANELPTGVIADLAILRLYAEPGTSTLWIGSTAGLYSADTAWHRSERPPPRVFVRRVETVDGRRLFDGEPGRPDLSSPVLAPAERAVWIEFAAPLHTFDYHGRVRVRYRTRLEGLEADWTPWGLETTRSFTNLPPHDFIFHVQARDLDDHESAIASFGFTLRPPWWRTWWAIGLMSVTGVGGVVGATRWFANRVWKRRMALLEAQSAVERERLRLARDLHDEVGSGLGRVILFAGEARRNKSDPAQLDASLDRVRDSAQELVQHAREIVWAVSPQHDSLASVIERFGDYTGETLRAAGITCKVELPSQENIPAVVFGSEARHSLFLAVKEVVHNCVKYSGAKSAEFTLTLTERELVVTFRDDGRGFASGERRGSGHGLRNLATRAEALGGRAEIASEVGKGTTVTLRVSMIGAAP